MVDDKKNGVYLNPNYVKEWENSRKVLARFDGYLNDLRKYGFTIITALLAASGLLLPYTSQALTPESYPDNIKFVVLLINLLIIVAVTAIDRNYTVFLKAAATRARVLERALNLELTEIITDRYRSALSEQIITGLYWFFMIMVLVLGAFVLGHDQCLLGLLAIFVVLAIVAVFAIRHTIRVHYPHGPIDYTLDRLQCTKGETVAITLTNLVDEELVIEEDSIVYEIRKQNGSIVKTEKAGRMIRVVGRDSYTWLWKVEENKRTRVDPKGICEVWRPNATPSSTKIKKIRRIEPAYKEALKKSYSEKLEEEERERRVNTVIAKKKVYTLEVDEKTNETVLELLIRSIRVEEAPEPSQTDSDKILDLIKKLLCKN